MFKLTTWIAFVIITMLAVFGLASMVFIIKMASDSKARRKRDALMAPLSIMDIASIVKSLAEDNELVDVARVFVLHNGNGFVKNPFSFSYISLLYEGISPGYGCRQAFASFRRRAMVSALPLVSVIKPLLEYALYGANSTDNAIRSIPIAKLTSGEAEFIDEYFSSPSRKAKHIFVRLLGAYDEGVVFFIGSSSSHSDFIPQDDSRVLDALAKVKDIENLLGKFNKKPIRWQIRF